MPALFLRDQAGGVHSVPRSDLNTKQRRSQMAKNIILWMLGVPVSVLILLNIFGYL